MKSIHALFAAALLAGASFAPAVSFAAAPADLGLTTTTTADLYALETVMVVQNWILCLSEPTAERMAAAREEGPDSEAATYADLAAQKVCGRFKKLGVMLHKSLYRSAPGHGVDTRMFSAAINIGVGWQEAFVIPGDPPQE